MGSSKLSLDKLPSLEGYTPRLYLLFARDTVHPGKRTISGRTGTNGKE